MAGEPTLRRGHHNPHDWVLYAQQMINHAFSGTMHLDGPENGVFDEEFEREVIFFQTQHGLGGDGEVGPNTWAALHRAVGAQDQAVAATVSAETDAQLRNVVYHLDQQLAAMIQQAEQDLRASH
jgi:peptidoglycan hydrolase-like protein with peptidoglycan-binding domain